MLVCLIVKTLSIDLVMINYKVLFIVILMVFISLM